jgi:hypothetical protein
LMDRRWNEGFICPHVECHLSNLKLMFTSNWSRGPHALYKVSTHTETQIKQRYVQTTQIFNTYLERKCELHSVVHHSYASSQWQQPNLKVVNKLIPTEYILFWGL